MIYHGYTIEPQTLIISYKGKQSEPITNYHITRKDGKTIYFYRSKRFESFKTITQAKSAIRNNRIFACGAIKGA